MTNVILELDNVFATPSKLYINAEKIIAYSQDGMFTNIITVDGKEYNVCNSVEEINQAVSESFFIVKPVQLKQEKPANN